VYRRIGLNKQRRDRQTGHTQTPPARTSSQSLPLTLAAIWPGASRTIKARTPQPVERQTTLARSAELERLLGVVACRLPVSQKFENHSAFHALPPTPVW